MAGGSDNTPPKTQQSQKFLETSRGAAAIPKRTIRR
jgi:hypothetical protein